MKYGSDIPSKKLQRKLEFRENRFISRHVLSKSVNEVFPYFPYFLNNGVNTV